MRPILAVQVEDAGSKGISKTDIGECIKVLEDVLGSFNGQGVAHSFQENYNVAVGTDRTLRYISPPDIQDDPDVRVVFF